MVSAPIAPATPVSAPLRTGEVIHSDRFPPARAARIAATMLNRYSAAEIGAAIEVLIDTLAMLEPPAEDEPDFRPISDGLPGDSLTGDGEHDGTDQGDQSAIEWDQLPAAAKRFAIGGGGVFLEDDEEDDPAGEDDDREEEYPVVPVYGVDQTAGALNPSVLS